MTGLNDSEVYFWYVIEEIAEGASFPEVIEKFEGELWSLWQRSKEKHDYGHPYVGPNVIFSDAERLYAYCKYEGEDESKTSLCLRDQPVFQMSYIADSSCLVVASEKTNREEEWLTLENGQLLTGHILGEDVKISLQEI